MSITDRSLRELEQLRRAVEELSLLNEVARAIGEAQSVDEMIHAIVRRSTRAVDAEQGAVLLIEDATVGDSPLQTLVRTSLQKDTREAFRPNPLLVEWMVRHRQPVIVNEPGSDSRFPAAVWHPMVRSVLCVPLVVQSGLIGLLALFNKNDDSGFDEDDQRLASILAAQSAQAISREKSEEDRAKVLAAFGRHISPAIVEEILRHGSEIPGRRVDATVLFLDVRGFTTFAEQTEPEEVVGYLNALFSFMVEIVTGHGGLVHQFLGDGFMALFGTPVESSVHAGQAVEAAVEIIRLLESKVADGEVRPTRIGIGIHSGELLAGTIGSAEKMQYSVTGDVVNLASRIEQLNKQFNSSLLVSRAVIDRLVAPLETVQSLGIQTVRGRSEAIELFKLV